MDIEEIVCGKEASTMKQWESGKLCPQKIANPIRLLWNTTWFDLTWFGSLAWLHYGLW